MGDPMPTITLKGVPPELHRRLKERAKRNRRSLNREAIVCLEKAMTDEAADADALLHEIREVRRALGLPRRLAAAEVHDAIDEGRV